MARPTKAGLDYFELDCHMDEKVELIEAEFGLKGFAVIVKLYQSIYSGFGYYCEWSPEISVLWAYRLGCTHGVEYRNVDNVCEECALHGFPKNLINEIVAASIRRNIFSAELFNKYRILTSSGIQKRYLNAVSRREKIELKKEYLLLSADKIQSNVVINSINADKNEENVCKNLQSKEEKSRVKESKEKNNKAASPPVYYPNDEKLNQAFADFVDMRKQMKKPMTERAVSLAMNKLKELSTDSSGSMDNDVAIKILEQSTMNCWQGLYALKEEKQFKSSSNVYDEWRNA